MWALYRRKWLIATVVAVALAGAAVYNRTTTPVYEARARLLLEPNIPDVVPFRASNADQGRLDYYLTQLEVLKSQSIARKTLETLNLLDADPRRQPAQVSQLLRALVVVPVRTDVGESRVISICTDRQVPISRRASRTGSREPTWTGFSKSAGRPVVTRPPG